MWYFSYKWEVYNRVVIFPPYLATTMIKLFSNWRFDVDCFNLKPLLQPMTSYQSVQSVFLMPYLLLFYRLWCFLSAKPPGLIPESQKNSSLYYSQALRMNKVWMDECAARLQPLAHCKHKKCPSDLRKMPFWPTQNAHPTCEKCPSDLRKRPIRPKRVQATA